MANNGSAATPKVLIYYGVVYLHQKRRMSRELFSHRDLEKFLKEHEDEWWTPYEIKKELGVDIRTVKNKIRILDGRSWETTYKGWRMDIAERGDRLYVVRMVRDIEGSRNLINAEISEVEDIPDDRLEEIFSQRILILKYIDIIATRDAFLRYLENARHHQNVNIRFVNIEKLKEIVKKIKEAHLKQLKDYIENLSERVK